MQKLRRMNFFDREVVKKEGADIHPGVQKLNVSCACGGPDHLWFGDKAGEVRQLDQQFALTNPVQVFERELTDLKSAQEGQRLVALGVDAPASGGTRYKVFEVRREEEPVLLHAHRVSPPRGPEQRGTCLAVNSTMTVIAVGTEAGAVYLFRGRNLAQEKPSPKVIAEDGGQPVTSLHFLEEEHRTVLYICNLASVRSWVVIERDEPELRLLNVATSGGNAECCSCVFPMIKALLVAKGDAIFAYDPDEGNMSAMPLEGEKQILVQFKSYFVAVTSEGGPGALGGGMAAAPSSMPKQNVVVCLAYPHMRFIAYTSQFTDVTHVVVGMGSIFVVSRGGADSNTVLFELREKELSEQLDILVKKRMFEWAADIARLGDAPAETRAEIYRQHGDALFEKRAYDQALAIYMKTVDLKLPLEPSYVVELFLDAQRIGHVAKYLKRLHEMNLAEREHTALLLKCYTKLKDFSTLGAFLETTPVSQYDPATAIEVLEAAGYYGLAAEIAQRVESREDYVRISLEHFKNYAKTIEYLRALPKAQASCILLEHGRVLMQHAPSDTIELVREICGLRADGELAEPVAAREGKACVDELLPIFVEDQPRLELFLRSVLLASGGCQLPAAEAERLYPTLLELMVRSHHGLLLAEKPGPDDEQRARRLHGEIMRLIRQYPGLRQGEGQAGGGHLSRVGDAGKRGEGALASTLMLCQTYGFVDGFFHAAERLGRFQLLMNWCCEQKDSRRLLEVCKRCGSADQSLWVQALSFLAADDGDHTEEIGEVLRHVEESSLMPLLMVIATLQKNPGITVGAVRPYLQGQFRKLAESVESNRGKGAESVETSRAKAWQDRQEIARMQQEIVALRTQAQVFQNTKCSQCALTLEVPAVHFFCGHSYHSYCVPSDGGCPKCSSEALSRITLKEQREAQARNTEDFFKELQGGSGEGGIQAIGEWCMFGAFDAGQEE